MKIGLLSPMADEARYLLSEVIKAKQTKQIMGQEINGFTFGCHDFVHYTCGIGKANASFGVTLLALGEQPDCIILYGTAGALQKELLIGDIVVGDKMYNHDVDVSAIGFRKGEVPFSGFEFGSTESLLEKTRELENGRFHGFRIYHGHIVTGDQFITDQKYLEWIKNEFNPKCVAMEDAAAAMIAAKLGMPFLAVRGISDNANHDASSSFAENLALASKNATNFMLEVAESMDN